VLHLLLLMTVYRHRHRMFVIDNRFKRLRLST